MLNFASLDDYPSYPLVELAKPYEDARGIIQNVFTDGEAKSLTYITSKAGTRRADHWHKFGSHLCILLAGKMVYRWRDLGSANSPGKLLITPGQSFYTPPRVEHSMEFTEDSIFIVVDPKVSREHQGYEDDIVRLAEPLQ